MNLLTNAKRALQGAKLLVQRVFCPGYIAWTYDELKQRTEDIEKIVIFITVAILIASVTLLGCSFKKLNLQIDDGRLYKEPAVVQIPQ
jgi:hypothetical protein